jgi:hypothetical protein
MERVLLGVRVLVVREEEITALWLLDLREFRDKEVGWHITCNLLECDTSH